MRALLYPIFLAVLLFLYARYIERAMLFVPSRQQSGTPQDVQLAFEDIFFLTGDNVKLHGWFINAKSDAEKPATLLYLHGNAGNISGRLDKLLLLSQTGMNIFIFDYRGYGQSAGYPTEKGVYQDALAAYDYLVARRDVDPKRVVIYGASLGGAVAVDLAAHRPAAGLILDSTFSNAADMAKKILPFVPSFFVSAKLDSIRKIVHIATPKLFIHSPTDETVPYALGRKLFEAAPAPKDFLDIRGGHNDGYLESGTTYVGGIKAFLRKHDLL